MNLLIILVGLPVAALNNTEHFNRIERITEKWLTKCRMVSNSKTEECTEAQRIKAWMSKTTSKSTDNNKFPE
jgi:hypothetical protein